MTLKKTRFVAQQLYEHFRPTIDTVFLRGNALFVKSKTRFQKQFISDILYIQAHNVYIDMYTTSGVRTLSMSIARFESQLGGSDLIRVNRSQLVNVSHIDAFESHRAFIGTMEFRITDKFKQGFYNAFQIM